MTSKEAIWVLKSTSVNSGRISGKTAYAEALEMAITALQAQDIDACRVSEVDTPTNAPTNTPTDYISRQAAIDTIEHYLGHPPKNYSDIFVQGMDDAYYRTLSILRTLPSVQPLVIHCTDCEDWLERQSILGFTISELPSAQPEIIRCKDCEYGKQDEYGRWYCRDLGCQIGNEDGSGFCANAERRTDEQT